MFNETDDADAEKTNRTTVFGLNNNAIPYVALVNLVMSPCILFILAVTTSNKFGSFATGFGIFFLSTALSFALFNVYLITQLKNLSSDDNHIIYTTLTSAGDDIVEALDLIRELFFLEFRVPICI